MSGRCGMTNVFSRHEDSNICQMDDGQPCPACRENADLDAQILVAQQTIDKLMVQKHEVRTKLNEWHDPITRKLPRELVSIIFRFSLPDYWDLGELEDVDHDTGELKYCKIGKPILRGPLFLGKVCRAWRDIAWTTPSLWTVIRIFLDRPQRWSYISVVSDWLNRSGQLPLSIRISRTESSIRISHTESDDSESEDDYYQDPDPDDVTLRLIDLIDQDSYRWENLDVEGPYETVNLLGGYRSTYALAPRLRRLTVENVTEDGALFSNTIGLKPAPNSVWMKDCRLKAVSIQWSNVTNIYLGNITVEEVITLLQSAPLLAHCRCEFVDSDEEFPVPPQPTVHHALQSLRFEALWLNRPSHRLTMFFNSFTFPCLAQYAFEMFGADMPWDGVLTQIVRSSCPLTSLSMSGTLPVNCDMLIAILRETPLLRELKLSLQNSQVSLVYVLGLFNLLAQTSISNQSDGIGGSSSHNFLPNLESLSYSKHLPAVPYTRDTEDIFWESVASIFGPAHDKSQIPKRRSLQSLRIGWRMPYKSGVLLDGKIQPGDKYSLSITKSVLLRLLELADAGVSLDMRDEDLKYDLLALSMKYHGIVHPVTS